MYSVDYVFTVVVVDFMLHTVLLRVMGTLGQGPKDNCFFLDDFPYNGADLSISD